jgi:hypothetical protein
MICRDCNEEFVATPGKPGFINQCEDCASDTPVYRAEQGTEDSGVVETMTKGNRIKSISGIFGGGL